MENNFKFMRLSDRILFTLDLALEQKDIEVSEMLLNALEIAMTRNAGGKDFTDRRDFSDKVKQSYLDLAKLKKNLPPSNQL